MFSEQFDSSYTLLCVSDKDDKDTNDYDKWDSEPAREQENLPDGDGKGR
ncbi:MAG: hypothetical protein AB7T59_07750 [Hyphomonadaceae bacterium]